MLKELKKVAVIYFRSERYQVDRLVELIEKTIDDQKLSLCDELNELGYRCLVKGKLQEASECFYKTCDNSNKETFQYKDALNGLNEMLLENNFLKTNHCDRPTSFLKGFVKGFAFS